MATQQDIGLWRPANSSEGEAFISKWCAHCIHEKAEDWEDEFGNDIDGKCDVLTNAYIGPVEAWVYRDGKPACLLFKEDPTNPARCPHTKEMF
ncbi:hypothetical protein [Rhizobium rhizogenes]|uniref:hypothetical protein n=1 Tax=Rhizobium rhizogenes TaxID=359 RepID=UPI0004D81FAF|nr:hypothetical protein [Rhizobium rhizogenes]KEA07511.1 hypothetical protein CN09_11465 [Rhizobium rhizogenes]NTJ22210.1 hypothetical protein [Rhizobium rhizogenes]QUE80929.1 hypothetical protein EML492_03720 [Rhizobium rhizogenes]TQO80964.1 hypothetical protein FFE80_07680 [Rhizobium rhizogenes]TRB51558.1 hypothetical protein EXN69_26565 [Rhizobium rhizogenes]